MILSCPVCDTQNEARSDCAFCGTVLHSVSNVSGALAVGTRLQGGAFALGRLLGMGGFGLIYLGVDIRLHRLVAVKEFFPYGSLRDGLAVHAGSNLSEAVFRAARERFLREAQVSAQFEHPGIVRVHAFFEENDTGYMVMELLRGSTLREVLDQSGPLEEGRGIDYVARVAEALAVVHAAGFVHRDLKPDNIFLTREGRVVLLDFGTAKELLLAHQHVTAMVSPGYAPPEQYLPDSRPDPRVDVYALGATLYHLLTASMPPDAPNRLAGVTLPPPSSRNPLLTARADAIVEQAMALDPARRPANLHDFLQLLTAEKSPFPAQGQAQTQAQATDASAVPFPAQGQAQTQALATDASAVPFPAQGQALAPAQTQAQATDASAVPPVWDATFSTAPTQAAPLATFASARAQPSSGAFTGPMAAHPIDPAGCVCDEESSPFVRGPDLARLLPTTAGAGGVTSEAPRARGTLPPDPTGSRRFTLREITLMQGHSAQVRGVDFTPDLQWVLSASEDRTVRIWGAQSTEEHGQLRGHEGWISAVRVSPDGRMVVTASHDCTVRLWDFASRSMIRTIREKSGALGLDISPDGRFIAASFIGGVVVVWDLEGRERARTPSYNQSIWNVAFSPDATLLAFGLWTTPFVQLWDVCRWKEAGRLEGHHQGIRSVAFSADGSLLATASNDRTIRIWDVAGQAEAARLEGYQGSVRSVAFHPQSYWLASGGSDKTIRLWDVARHNGNQVLESHRGEVCAMRFSPDGRLLATGAQDERVGLFAMEG